MRYTISESWGTEPSNPTAEFGLYIVHSDNPDGIEKTFRWYADAVRYRDALNEVTSTEPAADDRDDPDSYHDLLVDARLGVR